jgi:hypothetical protein
MKTIKVYIKYSNKFPYLPEAIADNKRELAKKLGKSIGTVASAFSRKQSNYAIVEVEDDV